MHSAIVSHQSPALAALVGGGFCEAKERVVVWDDIDEGPFRSFWEYAYTGVYGIPGEPRDFPGPAKVGCSEQVYTGDDGFLEAINWTPTTAKLTSHRLRTYKSTARSEKKRAMTGFERELSDRFQREWQEGTGTHDKKPAKEPVTASHPRDIITHHISVYSLADRYGITGLMRLSFNNLHRALLNHPVPAKDDGNIVLAFELSCAESVPDRVRRIMGHYAACNISRLWKSDSFRELVGSDGSLPRALVDNLVNHIADYWGDGSY